MPRLINAIPKYRKHRASGQAIVTLCGQDHYLGPYGTKTSKVLYDRHISEWLQSGRTVPQTEADFTVVELLAAYVRHAKGYYRKNGEVTREAGCIKDATRYVKELYGITSAAAFGPLALQVVQAKMTEAGLSRGVINKHTSRIKRMFKWGVAQQLVPPTTLQALLAVRGLAKGRTEARETEPVMPVDDWVVDATLPHLPEVVADMVKLQRLTGARPGEICMIRPCDIDRTADQAHGQTIWLYRPESHKTEHHGRGRVIAIGPRGQDVLRPYLLRDATAYCFSPAESERKRRAELHEARNTPIQYGNSPGTNRKRKPHRSAGERYSKDSYRRAVARAVEIANGERRKAGADPLPHWHPNQLRHSMGTEVRQRFGLEAAQVVLGHSKADVTQVYAERDLRKAVEVARQVG